ncbi:MAG TPA: HNH endonuclease signature motif containing protein, partial [Acidimicrobiales bacterium]|nr:HNH endonuclease signature motif containing protein [Acidimicrobiales bacterium]
MGGAGARSPAEHLAQLSGTTTGRARAALESSKRLAALPAADQAVARGDLSEQQAEAITRAAGAEPAAEKRLLELAKRRDLRRLREECARVQARAEDEAARAERLHRQRSLRTWTGADGSWNLAAKHTPEVGAQIEAALAPLKETIFQAARRAGNHEPGEAYGADALAEMARRSAGAEDARPGETHRGDDRPDGPGAGPGGSRPGGDRPNGAGAGPGGAHPGQAGPGGPATDGTGGDPLEGEVEPAHPGAVRPERRPPRSRRPDTKVIVLIDHDALKRGWTEGDEVCEIAGVGPVSVAVARSLASDAFGAAVVTNGVDVFTVAHVGRSVTAHQRSALEARGYRCEVPGCGSSTALEIDHIEGWTKTFRTKLDALAWLCRSHHLDKTHRGWRMEGPPAAPAIAGSPAALPCASPDGACRGG